MYDGLNVIHARVLRGVLWSAAVATAALDMEQLFEQRRRQLAGRHEAPAIVYHLSKGLVPKGRVGENDAATFDIAGVGKCRVPCPDAKT